MKRIGMTTKFAALALALFTVVSAEAQQAAKNEYVLRGRVEQVDATTTRLSIHYAPIEGLMDGMKMRYAVDNASVLNRVKVGDRITAKVYEGDSILHDVQVVPIG